MTLGLPVTLDNYELKIVFENGRKIFENGRKKRSNAAEENLSPRNGEVRITFEVESETEAPTKAKAPQAPRDTASTEFHPLPIRGEALSKTVLRERR